MIQRNTQAFVVWMVLHASVAYAEEPELFPANNATEVNPDTRLRLTFSSPPPLGNQGKIKIIDASNDSVADELDLSIPPGPRNNRTPAPYDTLHYSSIPDTVFTVSSPDTDPSHVYQTNYVGGTAEGDARHFFPVLIDQNVATITPHNNRLSYGKTYYVQIDPEAFPFAGNAFAGITGKTTWTFSTKSSAPNTSRWVVAADGCADFSTVQGALDAVPEQDATPREIFVKNGVYEEIISIRNKQNLTLHGEDRKQVLVRYANNGVFNRSGRAAFASSGGDSVNLINFTIQSLGKDENPAQAEALFVRGDKYQVHNVTMLGSGDALQIQTDTRIYLSRSSVRGYGDNLLSYGAAFFKRCDMISTYGPHGWPRNPQTNHGDVFVESTFSLEGEGTSGDGHCTLARSPASNPTSGVTFPYAEFVLINCKLSGIGPEGWGAVGPDASNVHFWEFNSVNLSDGSPVDVSQRAPHSRQLTMDKDAETIANYSNPSYVLAGWTPELAPVVLTRLPDALAIAAAGSVELTIDVAAEPAPTYQWFKDGQPLAAETNATLTLAASTPNVGASYHVSVENSAGTLVSDQVLVSVGATGTSAAGAAQGGAGGATAAMPSTAGAMATQAPAVANAMPSVSGGAGAPGTANANTAAAAAAAAGKAGAGTAASNVAASPAANGGAVIPAAKSGGGCSVGPSAGARDAWPVLLAGLAVAVRRRRRSRGDA